MAGLKRALLALLFAAHPVWGDTAPTAPAMLLAEVYAANVDISQYWVSEKFDGVRAQWDGHTLRFRGGGEVPAPAWFTAKFPMTPLDGELWIARDQFDALSGTVRKIEPMEAEWRQVRYLVFELPGATGDFSARVQQMKSLVAEADVPWLQAVEQTRVSDRAALMQRLDAVVKAGGEGLMLHRADALYLTGRSDALLKLKPWQDAEAVVVGYVPGKGKYAGMTGALEMEMPHNQRFRIGSGLSDALRRQPPPIGTRITYRYQHLTKNGVPRFPRYLRVRQDF
ncbi:MAG TPA: DNA ligase [Thiobacillus sp.]|nr:MAG: DNA ligase [Hydrogenophilales bacterium 28-61-11]OYZ56552.1 MAG: DNA ligase [Hydrogenophilales bacterium 16-61-112]OZA43250.1 MAG: DNA ligase [Hydrogenophilales bacterium 17-61-76]HQT31985.1 DNA ligase [Thiobacillus sp.]HQT71692.1 DNA ligase [Thiobacillus sp.]